ncbi:MAG: hypothetical protein CVU11_14750 [Bacteroidetes bacterium HGW-Bacteroidetes-6]|jgi:hypothetical protein|nr:MAG: hypothetical protein CVU11_14750 [Bacteroidetes bacterium HGW-Bacteroidetes-6]
MKHLSIIFVVALLNLPLSSKTQIEWNKTLNRECVNLDSIEVVNGKLLREINNFHNRNKASIDSNTCFVIDILPYKDTDRNSYLLVIFLEKNSENDLQWVKENQSCYFRVNNTLVLIPIMNDSLNLFKRTNEQKLFCFDKKEYVINSSGITTTQVGFKIKTINNSVIKVKKRFYFKHPYSWVQKMYYKIRYKNYF